MEEAARVERMCLTCKWWQADEKDDFGKCIAIETQPSYKLPDEWCLFWRER